MTSVNTSDPTSPGSSPVETTDHSRAKEKGSAVELVTQEVSPVCDTEVNRFPVPCPVYPGGRVE